VSVRRTRNIASGSCADAVWPVLACLVVSLALGIGRAPAADCGLKLLGTTELSMADRGPLHIKVTANERPATMVLNPASVVSAVMSTNMERFSLRTRTANQQFKSGGVTMTHFTKVNSFTVGSLRLDGPLFFVYPDEGSPDATSTFDLGWLGMDQLWGTDFELDFANKKLNFYSTKHCSGGGVVYWTAHYSAEPLIRTPMGNLIFPVELDGRRLEAVISTTNWDTVIRSEVLRSLYGFNGGSQEMTLSGIGFNNRKVRVGTFTEAAPASCMLTSHRTGAFFFEGRDCRGIEAPLWLGLDVVRHLHLYVATQEQVVYYSDADASK
jgi:hypothetical protein